MRRTPNYTTLRAFLQEGAEAFADAIIRRGITDFNPITLCEERINHQDTVLVIRNCLIDFLQNGCRRQTYLLDHHEAMGLPSWEFNKRHYNRCFMTLFLDDTGSENWRFTYTKGDVSVSEDVARIDLTFRQGLVGWAHTSTEGAPLNPC